MKDDKTRVIKKNQKRSEDPSADHSGDKQSQESGNHDEREASRGQAPEHLNSEGSGSPVTPGQGNKGKEPTRVTRPERRQESGNSAETDKSSAGGESMPDDPVVGWLAIVGGPGKGQARPLGYGMNGISRSADARVPLDFGDDEISRDRHAMVAYDPKSRRFFVHHGEATNLTYLEGEPVLQPAELSAGATISIGRTELRFVPLCGPGFDWQDV